MKVAVLFSGGKDSVFAVRYCLQKGWRVTKLIAVKPKDTEAFLYHFATVEWAKLSAQALGIPFTLVYAPENGPAAEAEVLEPVLAELAQAKSAEVVVLGGVGLQKTQITAVEQVARRHGLKVLVPHARYTSEQLLAEELESGMEIVITDVASDGLGMDWLGKKLTRESLPQFLARAKKFGFDPLGEGGYYNTFVVDAPFFSQRIDLRRTETVWDAETASGYLRVRDAGLVEKSEAFKVR